MSFDTIMHQPEIEQIRVLAANLQKRGYLAKFSVREACTFSRDAIIYNACNTGPFTVTMFHDSLKGLDGVYDSINDIYTRIWQLRIEDYKKLGVDVRPPSTEQIDRIKQRKPQLIATMGEERYNEVWGTDDDYATSYERYEWKCPKCETWGGGSSGGARYGVNTLRNGVCQGCKENGSLPATVFRHGMTADTDHFYMYTCAGGSYSEIIPIGTLTIPGSEKYLDDPDTKKFLDLYRTKAISASRY